MIPQSVDQTGLGSTSDGETGTDATTHPDIGNDFKKQLVTAALSLVISGAALIGARTWQSPTPMTASRILSVPPIAIANDRTTAYDMYDPRGRGPTTAAVRGGQTSGYTFYLVSSATQADAVRLEHDPSISTIAVVTSAEDLERVGRAAAEIENTGIVDLRAPAHATTIDSSGIVRRSHLFTYYLVGSQAQADWVEPQLQEADNEIAGAGAEPRHATLIVSSPQEEALVYGAASVTYDYDRDTTVVINRIVDLRLPQSGSGANTVSKAALQDNAVNFYLVDSEQQAAIVATGRLDNGVQPLPAVIVHAGSADEARWSRQATQNLSVLDIITSAEDETRSRSYLTVASQVREADGKSPLQVIDLRPSIRSRASFSPLHL